MQPQFNPQEPSIISGSNPPIETSKGNLSGRSVATVKSCCDWLYENKYWIIAAVALAAFVACCFLSPVNASFWVAACTIPVCLFTAIFYAGECNWKSYSRTELPGILR